MPKSAVGKNWVRCCKCDAYELFENSNLGGEYDQRMAEAPLFVCRWCKWQNEMGDRVSGLEKGLKDAIERLERVEKRVDGMIVAKGECLSVNARLNDGCGESGVNGVNENSVSETELGQKLQAVEKTLAEIGARQLELEGLFGSGRGARGQYSEVVSGGFQRGPVNRRVGGGVSGVAGSAAGGRAAGRAVGAGGVSVENAVAGGAVDVGGAVGGSVGAGDAVGAAVTSGSDASTAVGSSVATDSDVSSAGGNASGTNAGGQGGGLVAGAVIVPRFAEKSQQYEEGSILLVGDSLVRNVGDHLKNQTHLFEKLDFSGARIEHLSDKLKVLGDRPNNNVVVMVGTNNLQNDRAEVMMEKFGKLVSDLKVRKYKTVSLVGLVKRRDSRFDREVLVTNRKLKELCGREGIGFVEPGIDSRTMLGKDGVHLNWRSCDRVARAIFRHSCGALNFQ